MNSYASGAKINPHYHVDREIKVTSIQEMVYIKTGSVLVNLFGKDDDFFRSLTLSAGDLIFFVSGGHGFKILEETTIIEIKQGPYLGKSYDKVMIENDAAKNN